MIHSFLKYGTWLMMNGNVIYYYENTIRFGANGKKIEGASLIKVEEALSDFSASPQLSTLVLASSVEEPDPPGAPWSVRGARSMTNLVKRSSSEQIGVIEQESLINDSPELRRELVSGGGIESIVNRLSKWLVSLLFASIILLRHDGAALWAIIGSVSNSALSVALKRLLNQQRPATTLRTDPGMPSSHAQSISFISVFAVLTVVEWLGTNQVSFFLSCFILSLGSYFIKLRVSEKLHTSSQVVVGAIVGSVFCILWYTTWNSLLFEAFETSLLVQSSVFLVAAAFALSFAVYVLLNWFKEES